MRKDLQIYDGQKTKKKKILLDFTRKKKEKIPKTHLETLTNLEGKIKLKKHFQQMLSILNTIPSCSIYLTHFD